MKNNELTSKDVAYLTDIFEWNYVLCNKICLYLECDCEKSSTKELNNLLKIHEDICKNVVKILESGCKNG